jgi:uncharacterized membrane protein
MGKMTKASKEEIAKRERIESKIALLAEKAQGRKYKRRTMEVNLVSEIDADGFCKVVGKMTLSASENPEDVSMLKVIPMEVMFIDKKPEVAVAMTLNHLNLIPMQYGDAIFEEGFFDLLDKDNEEIGDVKVKQ